MKNFFLIFTFNFLLNGCVSKIIVYNNLELEKKITKNLSSNDTLNIKSQKNKFSKPILTTNDYIEFYSIIAINEMKENSIPASITLAQGILESGAGKGRLAVLGNNHFGIKCHGWGGDEIYHDDDKEQECFRKYDDPFLSFKDHSIFLTTRSRYAFLFDLDIYNYKDWAHGLKKAGYATDPKYPSKLIAIIEKYKLYRFDKLILEKK